MNIVQEQLEAYASIETSSNGMISIPLENSARQAFEALRKVLERHSEESTDSWLPQHRPKIRESWCNECRGPDGEDVSWPCPTVQNIQKALPSLP